MKEDSMDVVLESAAADARIKMEDHAKYLLRRAETIETASWECRAQLKNLDKTYDSNVCSTDASPPSFLAVSFDETITALGTSSDSENWLFRPVESSCRDEKPISPTGTPKQQTPALADDLSSFDGLTPHADNHADNRRIQELEADNQRLRETVQQCCKATLRIQTNADLKIVRLEFDVVHLRQQFADELAANSKFMVLNQSLRKQLQHVAADITQKKNASLEDKKRFVELKQLHQRELTVEKHLNGLITSRNMAIKESTALKKLLLGTCLECRQRLPMKRKNPDENIIQAVAAAAPAVARPTYQSSARQVLENLPNQATLLHRSMPQPLPPNSPVKSCLKKSVLADTRNLSPTTTTAVSQPLPPNSPLKSCLKKSVLADTRNLSPTTTTAVLTESTPASTPSPESPQTPRRKISLNDSTNKMISDGTKSVSPESPQTPRRKISVNDSTNKMISDGTKSAYVANIHGNVKPEERLSPGLGFLRRRFGAKTESQVLRVDQVIPSSPTPHFRDFSTPSKGTASPTRKKLNKAGNSNTVLSSVGGGADSSNTELSSVDTSPRTQKSSIKASQEKPRRSGGGAGSSNTELSSVDTSPRTQKSYERIEC